MIAEISAVAAFLAGYYFGTRHSKRVIAEHDKKTVEIANRKMKKMLEIAREYSESDSGLDLATMPISELNELLNDPEA